MSTTDDLLRIIETLGYLQIDTISIVERSHNQILWTRMQSFSRSMLEDLIAERKIFEYWSHAAAYLPIRDFRFSLLRKKKYSGKYKDWKNSNRRILRYVYDRIKAEGPLQSRDFDDRKAKSTGWWDWKPSKDALDFMFHEGRLMVSARKGFQKVYDLTERVLPADVDMSFPSEKEFYKHLILTSINSHGFAGEKEITYLRQHDKKILKNVINDLLKKELIEKIIIEGNEDNFYTTLDKLELTGNIKTGNTIHILSPFDNLIIQRKKVKSLFNFDYQIECYVPEAKRKFGYYCMPVLSGDSLIGKIDAKADRLTGTFIIKNIFLEEGVRLNERTYVNLEKKLTALAKFTGCLTVSGFKLRK
ncbi:MAG: crosslink repair DNA glycosylase YcaQ family protein [bacterium]|nr:crosslink repair DNA glycosylase YcaQ family protein [bacterium]